MRAFNLLENLERGFGFPDGSAQDSFIFVVWSPDGNTLVAGGEREVRIWDLRP